MKIVKQKPPKVLKQFVNSVGIVCLALLGDEQIARISLRRQWLSLEITKCFGDTFNCIRVKLQTLVVYINEGSVHFEKAAVS